MNDNAMIDKPAADRDMKTRDVRAARENLRRPFEVPEECPPFASEKAKELWPKIGPMLIRYGVYVELDTMALGFLLDRSAEYLEIRERFETAKREGFESVHEESAYRKMYDAATRRLLEMLREFGMTPKSRYNVVRMDTGHAREKENSDMEADLFGDVKGG